MPHWVKMEFSFNGNSHVYHYIDRHSCLITETLQVPLIPSHQIWINIQQLQRNAFLFINREFSLCFTQSKFQANNLRLYPNCFSYLQTLFLRTHSCFWQYQDIIIVLFLRYLDILMGYHSAFFTDGKVACKKKIILKDRC